MRGLQPSAHPEAPAGVGGHLVCFGFLGFFCSFFLFVFFFLVCCFLLFFLEGGISGILVLLFVLGRERGRATVGGKGRVNLPVLVQTSMH